MSPTPTLPAQDLSYSLAPGAPAGATIDGTGLFTWTPSAATQIKVYSIGVVVTDSGSPPLGASQTLTVNVVPFNHPPVLDEVPAQTVEEGSQLTVDANATDPDAPAQTLVYSLGAGAPPARPSTLSPVCLPGCPTPTRAPGSYSVTVIVTDNGPIPKSGSTTFTINVLAVNHPPVVGAIPALTATSEAEAPVCSQAIRLRSRSTGASAQLQSCRRCSLRREIDPTLGSFHLERRLQVSTSALIRSASWSTDNGSPAPGPDGELRSSTVLDTGPSPAISRATVTTKHGYAINLKFSQPLDPATALDPNNYILIGARLKKPKQSPPATPIPLAVSYNATTSVVTLTALAPVKRKQTLKLTVIGTPPRGVAKITGRPMAGTGKRPGTNYVATISGKTVVHK